MSNSEPSKSLDVLGIKPVGESLKVITEATVRQAEAFLTLICQPAAKEFGLLLKDQVKALRQANLVRIANKAEKKLNDKSEKEVYAHPRVITLACESGSWSEEDEVQEMWAGLIASACTEDGQDDSNLVFVQLLGQLTARQAKFIRHLCQNSKFYKETSGWIYAGMGEWKFRELTSAVGYETSDRFRTEISHLRQLGLIDVWFSRRESELMRCGPTALALELYARSQGSRETITHYYEDQQKLTNEDVVDYPNATARVSEGSADEFREELREPTVGFSYGFGPNLFWVGVKNTGLVPIHKSRLIIQIPYGLGQVGADFRLGEGFGDVLLPGDTQKWFFPLSQTHFALGKPIKEFVLSQPPNSFFIVLQSEGKEVSRFNGNLLTEFFQTFG